jgi:hypothetical protein
MTGAGKSVIVADLLAQIGHRFGFRLIVEEGLSHAVLTQTQGCQPVIINPNSNYGIAKVSESQFFGLGQRVNERFDNDRHERIVQGDRDCRMLIERFLRSLRQDWRGALTGRHASFKLAESHLEALLAVIAKVSAFFAPHAQICRLFLTRYRHGRGRGRDGFLIIGNSMHRKDRA